MMSHYRTIQALGTPAQARNNTALYALKAQEIFTVFPKGSIKFTSKFRKTLWKISNERCAYCGVFLPTYKDMSLDHFIPQSKNGTHDLHNLVCACKKCNLRKQNGDIESLRLTLALADSIIDGVILPKQARQLLELGVELPITLKPFYFETML